MVNHPNRSKQQQAKHTPFQIPTTKDFATQEACGCIHGIIGGHPRLQFCHTHKAAPELLAALKTANTVLRNIAAPFGVKNGNEAIGEARLSEIRASFADTSATITKAQGR